ncbi:transcription termination/antitermination protein NusA [bacterium]|nr:transcription termination/antitermination protein NusA [bacterium]
MKLGASVVSALQEIEFSEGIPREVIVESLREAIRTAYYKSHGPVDNLVVDVQFGEENEIEAYLKKTVVDEVTDQNSEIAISEVVAEEEDAEVGDIILSEVSLDDLGILAIHYARQKIKSVIKDAKRNRILREYKDREFDVMNGNVLYVDRHDITVEVDGDVEAILPYREQISTERYQPGQRIKALLVDVRTSRRGPMLVLSRTHPDLIRRLMENEIPEVREGAIEIVAIARDPGYRAKVAVRSNVEELDAVGTCIGSKGIRILAISHELNDEKIDLILYKEDLFEYIREALSPANVASVEIFEGERKAVVIVPNDQISLAIGKGWRNVKLASKLTKFFLDVKSVREVENEDSSQKTSKEKSAGQAAESASEEQSPAGSSEDEAVVEDDVDGEE